MVDADDEGSEPAGPNLDDDLFRALLEATPNAAVLFRADGGIVSINRVGLDMLGLSAPAPTWSALWPEALRADADYAAREAIAGRRTRFRSLIPSTEGAPRWVDTTISPALVAGQVAGMLATSRDVTAEIETQSFLDNVVEYVPAALFARDAADGRYVMLNLAAEDMFGLAREQILGRTDAQLFPADRVAVLQARDAEVIASGRVSEFDEPYETRDETRFFRTRLMATFGDEGPRHLIGVSEDVSESRRATEALRAAADRADAANRSKSEFLANMSHEIRTPLNGVVGVADVLARTALTDGQRDMVEIIRSSGETLERLLSDVLDLARIESGRVEIESEPFNLADAARAVTGLLSMRAQEKGVVLTLSLDPAAETRVVGDVVRLKQILTNLLSNAVKFTARGEVRLTVQAVPGDHPRFRFAVRDTGVGFDASQKDRVFTRFQ
jgi:PAS domain S-box-containing protein